MTDTTKTEVEAVEATEKTEATKPSTTKKTRQKQIVIKNTRGGKLFVCGQILEDGEEYTLTANDKKNKHQMQIVRRLKMMGMIKEL